MKLSPNNVWRIALRSGLALLLLMNSSCIVTYRRFPAQKVGAPPCQKKYKTMAFHIDGVAIANGHDAIRQIFRNKSPFENVEYVEKETKEGLYVDVKIQNVMPSLPSLIFGYISLCLLTITPAWSTTGGTDISYQVYQHGTFLKSYTYEVRRKGFVWIILLPFAWANAMTYSESDAFSATAMQFFEDAQPSFTTL